MRALHGQAILSVISDTALPAPPFQADERLLTLCHLWQSRGWHGEIVAITGEDWTRRKASELDRRFGRDLTAQLRLAVRSRRPLVHATRVLRHEHLRATRLLLPVMLRR